MRISEQFDTSAAAMLAAVRQEQLEGVIAKRKGSLYESGKQTGSWIRYRVNHRQELVIGGYLPGPHGFDSLILRYYRGEDLVFVARICSGFVPAAMAGVRENPSVGPAKDAVRQTCRMQVRTMIGTPECRSTV
jgi:ATP-dependent DNA ligase